NLSILGFFKYYGFFADSFVDLMKAGGWHVSPWTLSVILPAGVSFYTFQSMSYTIDVYRGETPAKSFLDFALFVAFFPQLVAGPINRGKDLLPQFDQLKRLDTIDVKGALVTFWIGFVKKAVIADNIGMVVDQYFANPAEHTASAAWIAVLFYAVQIYCDFSGYTDMAIASARLFGFELVKNFDFPYFAPNVTAFWRRWHISLSFWLRDYLYVPLGGNRHGRLRTYRNLILTMLLGGLWHGAAWHFVAWGGLHGVALAVERALGVRADTAAAGARNVLSRVAGTLATFYFVCVCWVLFRAESFGQALEVLDSFVLLRSPGTETLPAGLFGLFALLALLHLGARLLSARPWWREVPRFGFALSYGIAFALAVSADPLTMRPFIYFQF
ncbi:MAG TPA: MBOAT family O-acyltransferase, partial [Polyangiaceae bacterium]